MTLTLEEIARRLKGRIEGDAQAAVSRLSGIREAEPGDLTFVASPKYASDAANTRATAVIVSEDWTRPCAAALVRVANPEKAFDEVSRWFAPPPITYAPGVHPLAVIAPSAVLGKDVHIGPFCVVEPGARIGDRTVLVASNYVGAQVKLGADCLLYPQVTLREYCVLGDRVILHNGTVIGSDGFGYVQEGAARIKVPQTGIVEIGNDVELGANVTVDRARFGRTRIGCGVKVDNLVQIAHNVTIGDHSVIVSQVGISGSASIGQRTILAGQVGVAGHVTIGDDVVVGAQSGVPKDIPSKSFVLGSPAIPHDRFAKNHAMIMRMPLWREKVSALEARLAKLELNSQT